MSDRDPTENPSEIDRALAARDRYRCKLRERETAEQRMARFRELQIQSFQLLQSSPAGLQHFLKRNYRRRRVARGEDGTWRPVSTA